MGWGKLDGTVQGLSCAGNKRPLDGATVQVDGTAGSWTLTTGKDGRYGLWLHQSASPVRLIATAAAPWQAQTAQARIRAGKTTTAGMTLHRAGCG